MPLPSVPRTGTVLLSLLLLSLSPSCAQPEPPSAGPATAEATPAPLVLGQPPARRTRPPRKPLPPPIAMPGGGQRINLRGRADNVRALELQPDGTYKQICVNAPEILDKGARP